MEGRQGDEYDDALSTLAEQEDIGWKVRLCLMDTQREMCIRDSFSAVAMPSIINKARERSCCRKLR